MKDPQVFASQVAGAHWRMVYLILNFEKDFLNNKEHL